MDFNQLWLRYKELVLIVATAILTLLVRQIVPGVWSAMVGLGGKVRASLGRRISTAEFERRYLEHLCEEHRFLKVRGIRTRAPVPVELEKVYISLTLNQPSVGRAEGRPGIGRMMDEEFPEGVPSELEGRVDLDMPVKQLERLSVGEALQRCQRLVILGGPGSGKTTLLSYLALTFARREAKQELGLDEQLLPVLIRLRDLPYGGLSLTADNLPALCAGPEFGKHCPEGFFEDRLKKSNCMVLLDGMDEVTTADERPRVAEQIDEFVSSYPENRFVVTSRPAGYGSVALTGFTQLDICDFGDEDVEAFARHWCLAVEFAVRAVEGGMSEATARRNGELEAEKLVAAIRASDRVRRLTVNPLLLTIVAMVHRYRATLPDRRVELYDECIQVLLGYWDEAKGIYGQLEPVRKRRVLERLAFWMHEQGLHEAERAQIEQVIAEALATVRAKGTQVGAFLKHVRERSGLLMERGLGIYGFSHLTFQEYLTASYLIDRGQDGREELLEHVHDPWWLEVTLLYSGMRDASPLVEAILSRQEDVFKTNLCLAARCLVDAVNIDPLLETKVVSELMGEFRAGEFQGLRDKVGEALIGLGSSNTASKVVQALLGMLAHEDGRVRSNAVRALGRIAPREPSVVDALLALLDDEHRAVRWRAVEALTDLGRAEPRIIEALLSLLGCGNGGVRWRAAIALSELGQTEPGVLEDLLPLVGRRDWRVHRAAAQALIGLRCAEPRMVETLLGLLGDEDRGVRRNAAAALEELGHHEPMVVEALLSLLTDKDRRVRRAAATTLGKLGQADPSVIKALLRLLGDEDGNIRWHAAAALGKLGQADPSVVEALLRLLRSEDRKVRSSAARALGELGQAQPSVVDALLAMLDDGHETVRWRAAVALGKLGQAEPRVIEGLLGLLRDEDGKVRWSAARGLGELGQAEPRVIEGLLGLLRRDDGKVRWSAARALGELGQAEPRVIDALLRLSSDEDGRVRSGAARALGELRQAEPRVIEALSRLLGDDRRKVRQSSARALGSLGQANPSVVEGLLGLLRDEDERVHWSAALALAELARVEPSVIGELLDRLEGEDPSVRGGAAEALVRCFEEAREITPNHVAALRRLLDSDAELQHRFGRWKLVKDVAWLLLHIYSEQTGKRIYRPDQGAAGSDLGSVRVARWDDRIPSGDPQST